MTFRSCKTCLKSINLYLRSHNFYSNTPSDPLLSLAQGVINGSRRDLSRSITLIESTHHTHKEQSKTLLNHIYQLRNQNQIQHNTKNIQKTFRIGVTGPPGAGKSTFVNKLGYTLCSQYSHKVAVLPIDPSSFLSGGSILGDQTRMASLSTHPNAYIRPSPNRLSLGGVTDTCYEVIMLCEAAGYDTIFVETVGVGQSEIEVANCVDLFALVITPTSGDDLQGLKKGIIEVADMVIVNKCDGDLLPLARNIKADYQRALRLTHSRRENWTPQVIMCSSLDDTGGEQESDKEVAFDVMNVWNEMVKFDTTMLENNEHSVSRQQQSKHAAWKYVWRDVRTNIECLKPEFIDIEDRIMKDLISPREGSQQILDKIWSHNTSRSDP